MPLTLSQFLLLIITIAFVVAATALVIFLLQLRRTAAEGERTLGEIRELAKDIKELNHLVKKKVEHAGAAIEASKRAAVDISKAAFFLSANVMKPTSKYLPLLIPIIRFFWRQRKKRKEEKNGR